MANPSQSPKFQYIIIHLGDKPQIDYPRNQRLDQMSPLCSLGHQIQLYRKESISI